jgi:predicted esterase
MRTISRRAVGVGLGAMVFAPVRTCTGASAAMTEGDSGTRALPAARRLRVLCLHGYHGSGAVLRRQMATWADALVSVADFIYVDAPSLAAGDFGWWHATDSERDPARDDPGLARLAGRHRHYKGWTRTRTAIISAFETQGPFDGILGFSQGAALAGLLVGLRATNGITTAERPIRFDFAILVSGFPSNDRELATVYDRADAYALPSFHLVGRADVVVPNEDSHRLASRFRSPVIASHDGGHVIPGAPEVVARVRAFLNARMDRRE